MISTCNLKPITFKPNAPKIQFSAASYRNGITEFEASWLTKNTTNISRLQRAHYRAVKNWLGKYQPSKDGSNLEKVRGYLEAYHHLCEVEAEEEAYKIIGIRIDKIFIEELHF